jgi:prepilin-type N-terminal cleavage/methylation domain-containing protein
MLTRFVTPATSNRCTGLDPDGYRECGLLLEERMGSRTPSLLRVRRAQHGFTLLELLMVVAIVGILGAVAIGVTPGIVRAAKGETSAAQVTSFLKRTRELAISRRRNIEIRFLPPNQIQSAQRAVPDPPNALPAPTVLETMSFEGRLEYRRFGGVPDTPDLFGNTADVNLGGANPVMFTSEGTFADANGDPVNASVFLGVVNQRDTANAITVLGTTAAVRSWRYDGSRWVQ